MASREPGEYAFTPPLGGRDFHPHRDISYQGSILVFYPPDKLVSEEHIAQQDTCKKVPYLLKYLLCNSSTMKYAGNVTLPKRPIYKAGEKMAAKPKVLYDKTFGAEY